MQACLALVAVLLLCTAPLARASTAHYIFSAECTHYMDWQSVGLYHSWKRAGSPGRITRLLSCEEDQLKSYKWLDLLPTHVHPPMNQHHPGDWYPPYNLPGSVLHWITHNDVQEDFVVKLDGDMVLRKPFIPEEVGALKGAPVGGYYGYLHGVDNGMSQYFLQPEQRKIASKVGGWVVMATEDMRRVAPMWLEYTEKVREYGPPAWNMTGDAYVSIANPKPWISEMYGFVFGCASVGLKVKEDGDRMLYPGYTPWNEVSADPFVLHYGLQFTMGSAYRYDKHDWSHQDMLTCSATRAGPLFPATPPIESLKGTPDYPKDKEEMTAYKLMEETIEVLNTALAIHHREQGCIEPGVEPVAKTARLRGAGGVGGGGDAAAVGVTPVVHADETMREETEVKGRWRIYGTVRDGNADDTVVLFKRARNGERTVCAEMPVHVHENTDFGKDPFYEQYIRAGEAPCHLKDEDVLLISVRTVTGVVQRTPEWLKATFLANMEQQIAIETLPEANQEPRVVDNGGGGSGGGGGGFRPGGGGRRDDAVERSAEAALRAREARTDRETREAAVRRHHTLKLGDADGGGGGGGGGGGNLVIKFQGESRAVPGIPSVESLVYYYPPHPLMRIAATGLMWGVFAMLLLVALGLPRAGRGGAMPGAFLYGGMQGNLRRLTHGTKPARSSV